jgi:CheY-like chemotaxis protein
MADHFSSHHLSCSATRTLEILLVEDDAGDVDLIRETLEQQKIALHLQVVQNGVEAIAYLRQEGPYAHAVRPDLILLDLNLPKKDGRQVLQEIKNDTNLKVIPVIVLTTSNADQDILKSYGLGANSYVTKPVGLQELVRVVNTIIDFWFTVVKLPSR